VAGTKSKLKTVDWQKLFCYSDAKQNWLAFKEVIEYLQMKYIPGKGQLNKRRKPNWTTNKALKAVRHRCSVYRKYKDTRQQYNDNDRLTAFDPGQPG